MSDDENEVDDEEILENANFCDACNEVTAHELLREKPVGEGRDVLLKCVECSVV